jgi:hypothetical protein
MVNGMPAEDARLAFGDPIKVKSNETGSIEKWYYEIKILRFANGKLNMTK